MDELYSTINIDELSRQSTWTSSTLLCTLTSSSHQSSWTSSTQLFTLTSSPISQHGRALLYYSQLRALSSVNMDELYSTIHSDELSYQPTWTSSTLLFTLMSSSHQSTWTSSTQLLIMTSSSNQSTWTSSTLLFILTSSSHQSTWTSSTLLFALTSSSLSSHGQAQPNRRH